jgi:tRNA (mo5U34)-methyltransferase
MSTAILNPETESSDAAHIRERIAELGDWFHNLDLQGVPTAPNHFLGD